MLGIDNGCAVTVVCQAKLFGLGVFVGHLMGVANQHCGAIVIGGSGSCGGGGVARKKLRRTNERTISNDVSIDVQLFLKVGGMVVGIDVDLALWIHHHFRVIVDGQFDVFVGWCIHSGNAVDGLSDNVLVDV